MAPPLTNAKYPLSCIGCLIHLTPPRRVESQYNSHRAAQHDLVIRDQMARDIKDIRPKSSPVCRLFTHIFVTSLILLSALGIFLTLFYNAPLPSTPSFGAGSMDKRFWFVQIIDQSVPRLTGPTLPDPSTPTLTATLHKPIPTFPEQTDTTIPTGISPGNRPAKRHPDFGRLTERADLDNVDSRTRGRMNRFDGRKVYGFGVWGWCGWYKGDELGRAQCTTKAFWQLPKDAELDDPVGETDLPR